MGSAVPHIHRAKRDTTPNPSCFTGGFYKAPSNGATVNSLEPLDIEWDNTCLATSNVDIYVLSPGSHSLTPHIWNNIPFPPGKYTLQLQPRWWNDSSSQSLQIAVVPANSALGTNTLPAGPVITATYQAPADGKIPDIANPSANSNIKSKTHAPGKAAAGVLIPLFFICIFTFVFLRYQRKRSTAKTRRFSQALDKRMSTISSDWRSVSAAGAAAAIRNSIAAGSTTGGGSRISVRPDSAAFGFRAIRPSSGMADDDENDGYPMVEKSSTFSSASPIGKSIHTGVGSGPRTPIAAAAFAAERASRISRVSFATTEHPRSSGTASAFIDNYSRPSTDSQPSTTTSSRRHPAGFGRFQGPGVPPVPSALRETVVSSVYSDSMGDVELVQTATRQEPGVNSKIITTTSPTMSPRQAQGPLTLTPEDILARMNGSNTNRRTDVNDEEVDREMNEVFPALSMMCTGLEPSTPTLSNQCSVSSTYEDDAYDDYLLPPPPAPLAPIHTKSTPSHLSSMSMSMMTMTPDDMLRAYAERQRSSPPANSNNNGLRSPPPSAFRVIQEAAAGVVGAVGGSGSPKKGRKLSFRRVGASPKDREKDERNISQLRSAIGKPQPILNTDLGMDLDSEYGDGNAFEEGSYVGMAT